MSFSFTRFFSLLGGLALFIFAFLIPAALTYFLFDYVFYSALDSSAKDLVRFEVAEGTDFRKVSEQLETNKLIEHWWTIYTLARLKDADKKVRAGEYQLSASMTPIEMLEKFTSGEMVLYKITVTEGMRMSEIAKLLADAKLIDSAEQMLGALNNEGLAKTLYVPSRNFEGYLFPETYKFSRPISVAKIIETMVLEGKKRFTPEMQNRAQELSLSLHEVFTLASIVEKETGAAPERPTISSVFHNRLRIGMPLQSDPTVIYGILDFDGNLTRAHLDAPTPFNTYKQVGLPPTPICSPGIDSINAALHPADTDFLYFVAKGDGAHHFSKTYQEHRAAVEQYQKGKAALLNTPKEVTPPVMDAPSTPLPAEPPKPEGTKKKGSKSISQLDPIFKGGQ